MRKAKVLPMRKPNSYSLRRLCSAGVRRCQRGDTIVEVLIATAIVSLVLVGAYSITNHATSAVQDSQEHQEATSLVNRQLELIRSNSGLDTDTKECFDSSGAPSSDAGCKYNVDGTSGCISSSASRCYAVKVTSEVGTYNPTGDLVIPVKYTVHVTWDSLMGNTGSVSMLYGLPKVNTAYIPPAGGGADSASLDITPCAVNGTCNVLGGSDYHYKATLTVKSNSIPIANIQYCKWDWGDGTSEMFNPGSGPCEANDTRTHDYQAAVEMQSLSPWPTACALGSVSGAMGSGGHTYNVSLTIHTTSGSDIQTQKQAVYMPACWAP